MLNYIYLFLLRRNPFKGQFKLFLWLYTRKMLKSFKLVGQPLEGDFKLNLDTGKYIDACIYYTGDYEFSLKMHFKKYINEGMTVVDVGANIGFHTLYFAALVGPYGKVIAFEPMPDNFESLTKNIKLNQFDQVQPISNALSNKNEELNIHISKNLKNPGAHNLFEEGEKNATVTCRKGDDILEELTAARISFIKIDVEGYEYPALQGLEKTIKKDRPVIFFEYDRNYQLRTTKNPEDLFLFLQNLGFTFIEIDGYGRTAPFSYTPEIQGAEIIAIPD
ncbi:hypothetical protein SRABI36_04140 [Pedobacter sp. Bi36]|nr:hypothetical protein SRABI126_00928 [Pedobacter sp. Bi126]CAH0285338.1 hypothetical protein SRABI36_04140 [Pedobacter sp. Bi36]